MVERLQKILAQATHLSRRAAEKAIKNGLVAVNGSVVTRLGIKADPVRDRITLLRKTVQPLSYKIYIAFNKPRGTIVSKSDKEGRPTIWDRLHKEMREVLNSAGRLDFDSEGLIILTNDGDLIYKLTHPSFSIQKTYYVKVRGIPDDENIVKIRKDVFSVVLLRKTEKNAAFEVSIRERENRQIEKMFSKIGHPIIRLRRIAVGSVKLGLLKTGEWRYLERKEVLNLKRLCVTSF